MAKIDYIYAAVDDFGLITSSEARELGVSNAELVQQARRGKLERVARGVYRMPVWPHQEAAPYAIAVKAAGPNAYLCGESTVALLGLAPTDPSRIWVGSPDRVRKNLGEGVRVLGLRSGARVVFYEGVASQPVDEAIKEAALTIGATRAVAAAREAARAGYITEGEAGEIAREIHNGG